MSTNSTPPPPERTRPREAEALDTDARQSAYQSLGNHHLLENALDSTVSRFLEAIRLYRMPPGARLLEEGETARSVFFLISGAVRVVHDHEGSAFTPKVLAAPCHFGHMELLAGVPRTFQSVETISASVLGELSWTVARELLLEDHAFTLAWLEDQAIQFLHTADAIRHYAFGDLRARVASVLLSYADLAAPNEDGPVSIPFTLSLSALARHVASPKRSILRVVQALQDEQLLVSGRRGGMTVPNPARLGAALPFRRLSLTHRGRLPAVLVRRRETPEGQG